MHDGNKIKREPSKRLIFLAGAVGGIAPQILKWYTEYSQGIDLSKVPFAIFVGGLIITLVFTALAGFLAILWQEKNLLKAFYVGVSAPVIIMSAAQTFSPRVEPAPELLSQPVSQASDYFIPATPRSLFKNLLISEAFAQESEERPSKQPRALINLGGFLEVKLKPSEEMKFNTIKMLILYPKTDSILAQVLPDSLDFRLSFCPGIYDITVEALGKKADYHGLKDSVKIVQGDTTRIEVGLYPKRQKIPRFLQQVLEGMAKPFER